MTRQRREPANWSHFALLSGAVWAVSALLLVTVGTGAASIPAAVSAGLSGLLALAFGWAAGRQRRRRDAKVSSELTILSERLLRLENAARDDGRPAADQANLAADLAHLSRLVGDIADALDTQEHDIRALRARHDHAVPGADEPRPRPSPPPPEAVPASPATPSPLAIDLTSREDFARTAAAILRKLSARPEDAVASPPLAPAEPTPEGPVLSALERGRLELYLQPVVTLPQRRTRFFEAQPRLRISEEDRPASLVESGQFLPVLRRRGRLAAFDGLMLARVFAVARHISTGESGAAIILPISAGSLRDRGFVDEAARLFASDPAAAGRLMIAVADADYAGLGTGEHESLADLAAFGAALALNEVTSLAADWASLGRRGIALAAVDAGAILHPSRGGDAIGAVRTMARSGIHLVATGIDRESDIPDLVEHDVPFAQGSALGAPRPMRTDFAAPAASAATGPEPEPRVSFRDVLRRAG